MTFGLKSFLKSQYGDIKYDFNIYYPDNRSPDNREWMVTNGLGGYSSSTISQANTRRYHGLLISALTPPVDRHMILTRLEENVKINNHTYDLSTNYWSSGVISPTGYKKIESFSLYPVPTWVYEFDGNYVIKQLCLIYGTNELQLAYFWLPEKDKALKSINLNLNVLTAFRNVKSVVRGNSNENYAQFVSPKHTVVILGKTEKRMCMSFNYGNYQVQNNWWWDYHYMHETAQVLPDTEDLMHLGIISAKLESDKPFNLSISLDEVCGIPDFKEAVLATVQRQSQLIKKASLPNNSISTALTLACDQFLVVREAKEVNSVIEGYHWFNDSGRASMIGFEGLFLTPNKLTEAKNVLNLYSEKMVSGLIPNRFLDTSSKITTSISEYNSLDVVLWWGQALNQYFNVTGDLNFVKFQLPFMQEVVNHIINGTNPGVKMDPNDGLIRTIDSNNEFSWMDAKVANIPITARCGKAIELCALWYNYIIIFHNFTKLANFNKNFSLELQELSVLIKNSMGNFWNKDKNYAYDVIELNGVLNQSYDESLRANQIIAISLPHRFFTTDQEKSILRIAQEELLTPYGLRSLSKNDPCYQGFYGCGFVQADQYHRDLSYHQGCVWPYLLGFYADAYVNVYGLNSASKNYLKNLFQPLYDHLLDDCAISAISEIFDGNSPHKPNGAINHSLALAAANKWYKKLF